MGGNIQRTVGHVAHSNKWDVTFSRDVDDTAAGEIMRILDHWSPTVLGSTAVNIAPLPGGANNLNYVVEGGSVKAALRIANRDGAALYIDARSAFRAQLVAADLGVAPRILAWIPETGHMLSEFIEGKVLDCNAFEDNDVLSRVAVALQTLHSGTAEVRQFSPFDEIRLNVERAEKRSAEFPAQWTRLIALCWSVEKALGVPSLPRTLTHNDVVPQNFILSSAGQVYLIDWDFAGNFSPLFELGSLICTAKLSPQQVDSLLCAYYRTPTPSCDRRLLSAMSYVAAVRELAWAVATYASLGGREQVDCSFYEQHRDHHLAAALEHFDQVDTTYILRAYAR
jgi:thiamine kinase-like enzyme